MQKELSLSELIRYSALTLAPLALLFAAFSKGCTDEQHTKRILDAQGYTEIETCGYSWFACDSSDWNATCFKAKNSNNKIVTGTVCSGLLFKGNTIRFD